jgi:hypothetical protein
MGDIVNLHGKPISNDVSLELTVALARFSEGLLEKADVKRQFTLSDEVWEALGSDEKFIAAVRDESLRRMRDGSTKREKSQQAILSSSHSRYADDRSQHQPQTSRRCNQNPGHFCRQRTRRSSSIGPVHNSNNHR